MVRVIIDGNEDIKDVVVVKNRREQLNEALKLQINSFPLVMDRGVFEKSKEEKYLLRRMKKVVVNKTFKVKLDSFYKLKNK